MNGWICYAVISACINSTFGCGSCCRGNNRGVKKEVYYFQFVSKPNYTLDVAKQYFNQKWYSKKRNGVLLLKQVGEYTTNVFKVTGSGDDWQIEDKDGILKKQGCNPNKNTWVIVCMKNFGAYNVPCESFFYIDDVSSLVPSSSNTEKQAIANDNKEGAFDGAGYYLLTILAANTANVKCFAYTFSWEVVYPVTNADTSKKKDQVITNKTAFCPIVIGLNLLNVSNAVDLEGMFFPGFTEQKMVDAMKWWTFKQKGIDLSFFVIPHGKNINFGVLDNWVAPNESAKEKFKTWNIYCKSIFKKEVLMRNPTFPRWAADLAKNKMKTK